jgi:hypothetical protein
MLKNIAYKSKIDFSTMPFSDDTTTSPMASPSTEDDRRKGKLTTGASSAGASAAPAKRGRKPKYLHTIILEGVNARELYKRFKIGRNNLAGDSYNNGASSVFEYSGNSGGSDVGPPASTSFTEIGVKKPTNLFLDAKAARLATFVDYIKYGSLPNRTDLSCWHDHHPFSTSPIGCPIRFVDQALEKHQIDTHYITTTTPNQPPRINTNCYYLTMGIFCSFPCVLAFINSHKNESLYKDSKSLLYSLYYKLYATEMKIKPANDWQCLKNYGGNMTIEEFRRTFCTCNYVITPDIKRPFMVSVGKHVDEKQCGYY